MGFICHLLINCARLDILLCFLLNFIHRYRLLFSEFRSLFLTFLLLLFRFLLFWQRISYFSIFLIVKILKNILDCASIETRFWLKFGILLLLRIANWGLLLAFALKKIIFNFWVENGAGFLQSYGSLRFEVFLAEKFVEHICVDPLGGFIEIAYQALGLLGNELVWKEFG